MIKEFLNNIFKYQEKNKYEFILPDTANNISEEEFITSEDKTVSKVLDENLEYLKIKYSMLINSDIKLRKFTLTIQNKKISSALLYIDGMVSDENINDFVLQPLLLKNSIKMTESPNTNQEKPQKKYIKFNLENFIYSSLLPQNSVSKEKEFKDIISKVNNGFCALFVDTIESAICLETKGFKGRSVDRPVTESVVKGSHEGFVENIRTNTSMLRKIINNEKLIIEEVEVGKINKTKVAICYINDLTNDDLVAEAKYRINNLDVDYLLSCNQLEQMIKDDISTSFPQTISTERSDRACTYLLAGRVVALINGCPFALILPAILVDFLTSPEDYNLNYHYANFLRFLRGFALICALLVPGLYVAITMYHYEIIPSELLFAIIAAREAIPFPIFFEIIIMELSFELIQEASIRVPSSFSTTVRNNRCFNTWRCCCICKYCKSYSYNYNSFFRYLLFYNS